MSDWRGVIAKNKRKSWWVITIFFVIYVGLGLFMDFYLQAGWVLSAAFTSIALLVLLLTLFQCNSIALSGTHSKLITSDADDAKEKQLFNVVEEMKIAAGIDYMPKIYILDVDYLNAFASGWRPNKCCVAITRPLLNLLTRAELQAVMAHELTHIRNQDTRLLVTVTVMANILVFIVDILFRTALYSGTSRSRNRNNLPIVLFLMIIRIVLPIVTAILLLFLSRSREYMADSGAVSLTRRNQPLANALIKMHHYHLENKDEMLHAYKRTPHEGMRSMSYIYDPKAAQVYNWLNISSWFSTHPKLEDRLLALGLSKTEIKQKLKQKD
ncbi:MAG: zinc metalloprotease HtpX [Candidatus Comchoanobacterales bacterium]